MIEGQVIYGYTQERPEDKLDKKIKKVEIPVVKPIAKVKKIVKKKK